MNSIRPTPKPDFGVAPAVFSLALLLWQPLVTELQGLTVILVDELDLSGTLRKASFRQFPLFEVPAGSTEAWVDLFVAGVLSFDFDSQCELGQAANCF